MKEISSGTDLIFCLIRCYILQSLVLSVVILWCVIGVLSYGTTIGPGVYEISSYTRVLFTSQDLQLCADGCVNPCDVRLPRLCRWGHAGQVVL